MHIIPTIFLLTIVFLFLTYGTVKHRRLAKVNLGVGEDPRLLKYVRAHGNFIEYTPWAVLLLIVLEGLHAPVWLIYLLGGMLVLGRAIHAYGLIKVEHFDKQAQKYNGLQWRKYGMFLTLSSVLISVGFLAWLFVKNIFVTL